MREKIKNYFYSICVRDKILVIFLPLISVFIILTACACLWAASIQLKINSEILLENSVHQGNFLINDKMTTLKNRAAALFSTKSFESIVFPKGEPDLNYLHNYQELNQQIKQIAVDCPDLVDSILIRTKDDRKFSFLSMPTAYQLTARYQDLIRDKEGLNGSTLYTYHWSNLHEDDIFVRQNPREVLTLTCKTGDESSEAGMAMVINIPASIIETYLSNIDNNENGFSALLGKDSSIFTVKYEGGQLPLDEKTIDSLLAGDGLDSCYVNDVHGVRHLVSFERLKINDWMVITAVPVSSLLKGMEWIRWVIVFLVVVTLVTASIPAAALAKVLSKDLVGITKQLKEYEQGNSEVVFQTQDKCEVGEVAKSLNSLTVTIKKQIDTITEAERKKRRTELLLLQSQINPHFLYNSFVSIKSLMDLKKYDLAGEMFQALIQFYVSSLSKGKEVVTIATELDIVNNYLTILQIRYEHSFDWCVNVESDIMDCKILKLILQPLIENALYHGLKNQKEHGMLDISGCAVDDGIVITVWDNGVGMEEKELQKLQNMIEDRNQEERESKHFGLWNCNQRIKLHYGELFGIELDSVAGKYTSVTVRLPYINEEES